MTKFSKEPCRILVVDDDRHILDLLVELLELEGYEVSSAVDGASALEVLASCTPDLVVSDVVMPGFNGIELCRRIKQNSRTANIPVLLMSGSRQSSDDSIEGLTAGADDYLDLPFRNEELMVKVARLTERHRVEKHYREIVEKAADMIYTRTIDGYITSINAAGGRFFNRPVSDLIGVHLSELIGAEAAAKDIELTRNIPSDSPARSVHCLKDKKGHTRYLEGILTVERDREGKPAGVRGVVRDVTEQKLAEDALRESEERYRQLVELSPDAIVLIVKLTVIYANRAAQNLWGASSADELIGRSMLDLIHPDYRDLVIKRIRDITELGEPSPLSEQKHLKLNGEVIDVEVTGMPFTFGGQPAVQAVIRDITERKRARESLRLTEERYRELFENANDIIYTHDLSGNFTSLNRSGERITGYSWAEVSRMNLADVVAPEDLDKVRKAISNKAGGKASKTVYELDIIAKDGRRVRLEVSTRVITHDGKPVGVQGIARDLTERKQSEAALRESQAFFNSFMNNSPAIAFMKDEEGRYVYVNKPFEDLFGQKLQTLRGGTSFDWLPADFAQQTHEHDLQVLLTGEPQEIVESVPTHTQDGAPHYWLVFKFPINDVAGKRFVGGVGVDITERRRAEEALTHQAQREEMTHRISQAVRCSLDSSEIFQTAVRELGSYLNVDRCSLFMRNDGARQAMNVAEYHVEGVEPAAADFDLADLKTLADALQENGVLAFNDAPNDERIKDIYDRILRQANVRSIMYVAIRVGDEVPAAFALSTTREMRNWTESDITLAKAIADQTGIAIRQSRLYQKAEATSIREALVNRLTIAIRASLSLPEVLSTATRELGNALAASRVHLHLYTPGNPVSPVEHEFLAPGCPGIQKDASYDDPVGLYLLRTLQPLIINDALNYSEGPEELCAVVRAHAQEFDLRSQIAYPVIVKGQFRGVICIHQTDRKRHWTEDELALVEAVSVRLAIGISQAELFEMVARGKQEWETTFDSMSDGIFIFDKLGHLRRVNRAGAAMEHSHPRALLGRKCCDILRTSDEDETCVVERALEVKESVTIEITPAGSNRPLLVSIEPVQEGDETTAVVCTARDLSEMRKVEAVAREHQLLLTHILESARESIYAVDSEGRFKWCNSATLIGLGCKREDFIGRRLLDLVYEADRELVSEKLTAAMNGQAQTYQMRYFSPHGELRYARVDNSPLIVDGRTHGVLGIARDVTEQKEERERAARADKLRALGQLASGVAHDFNNSLAAILGRAQLLRRQTNDDALVRNLDIIQTAAEDAAATVRRIQTFARKAPAKEFEMLEVRSLLVDAIEITRTRWENEARLRGLDCKVELDANVGQYTIGSASELREVFVNLIVNAVDAMPAGGKISISCVNEGDKLHLRFADTGVGMVDDVQQKIFEPFFTTKGAQGTGLGLSVSYSIIERHDGLIRVESAPGSGAVFTIYLPACEIGTIPIEELPLPRDASPLSIMVIDDEVSVRETLADMLQALNHKVELATGGQEGVRMLDTSNFDLVFTDLAMPEMDGWETAREIRKRRPEMTIVLITGYGPGTLPPAGEDHLVNAIIGKPFDFVQVIQTIAEVRGQKTVFENVGA